MVKRVLMIAFHFPPMRGSSGAQRTLNFCRYLGEHGWEPRILTVTANAHPHTSADQLADIPPGIVVTRAPTFDAARHTALGGRYPRFLATPDRWASWWLTAVPTALREIARFDPQVIWSTFPIATAHAIGATLHRLRGLPWVADFRDLMTEDDFPTDARTRAQWRRIEGRVVTRASRAVFTTPGARATYAARYPHLPADRWAIIANGYAEEDFAAAELAAQPRRDARLQLLHSGLLYPSERDPSALFTALAAMRAAGEVSARDFLLTLRATGHDELLAKMIRGAGIEDLVKIEPAIGYRAALAEMLGADALLILQAANCNHQIPAKLYEYLRAARPVLALTDPVGDTARMLVAGGIDSIAPLDHAERIRERLREFLQQVRERRAPLAPAGYAASFSRRAQTGQLAALLEAVSTQR